MTGFGQSILRDGTEEIRVEIRSVNHRFFRLRCALSSSLARYEPEIEAGLRGTLGRGSVDLAVDVKVAGKSRSLPIDEKLLGRYCGAFRKIQKRLGLSEKPSLGALLALPGVIASGPDNSSEARRLWPKVRRLIEEASGDLLRSREREGRRMLRELERLLGRLERAAGKLESKLPEAVSAYAKRLEERVRGLLGESRAALSGADIAREIALLAERSDVAEEIGRLRSHISEFRKTLRSPEEVGRRLDFLSQEMLREANTIASKSPDAAVSGIVVECKSDIERIREQVQNIQ